MPKVSVRNPNQVWCYGHNKIYDFQQSYRSESSLNKHSLRILDWIRMHLQPNHLPNSTPSIQKTFTSCYSMSPEPWTQLELHLSTINSSARSQETEITGSGSFIFFLFQVLRSQWNLDCILCSPMHELCTYSMPIIMTHCNVTHSFRIGNPKPSPTS